MKQSAPGDIDDTESVDVGAYTLLPGVWPRHSDIENMSMLIHSTEPYTRVLTNWLTMGLPAGTPHAFHRTNVLLHAWWNSCGRWDWKG